MGKQNEFIQKSIINDMSEGVMIIGLDGIVQYMNPAAEMILNKKEDELTGKKIASVFFMDSRNDAFNQTILDAISTPSHVHYNLISYFSGDDEKTIYVMSSFLKSNERKIALIVILNDMTSIAAMRKRYTDKMMGLLDSLVQALSVAIDERSHYNARHTQNMVGMAEKFLTWLDNTRNPWRFSETKKRAFLMSVWLHDVGKLSVPLTVMDKATRLGDAVGKIDDRFRHIHLLDRISLLEGEISQEDFDKREKDREEWLSFIHRINTSEFLRDEDAQRVHELSELRYKEEDGTEAAYLTPHEVSCLLIRKGTLTDEERAVMQNHVVVTKKILNRVSFPDDYEMIPEWAGSHHELKNGRGYPDHKQGDQIPKEVCLLTILDIYEALTTKDRPYKKPMPPEKAWSILHSMADEGSLDSEVLELFEKSGAWKP